jgi:PKD repeat protein
LISCEKDKTNPEPIASFSMSKTSAEVKETITFTNTSKNATSYLWDFGDGNTSTDKNPTHVYSTVGNFSITLTASVEGSENSSSKSITISYPAPVASFTVDKSKALTGETITFTSTSQNAISYSWDFGDGNSSTDENPTHSYSVAGTFIVELTATGEGGSDAFSQSIEITEPPLIGKWIMESCSYNNSVISNVSGWIEFKTESTYEARFDSEGHYGEANAIYSIENANEFNTNIPETIIFFGYSWGFNSEGDWSTTVVCTNGKMEQFGATAILHTDFYGNIKFGFSEGKLVLTSPDNKTEITYSKE